MRFTLMACLFLVIGSPAARSQPAPASNYQPPAETKDRLSDADMEELVKRPMTLVRQGDVTRGVELFESMLGEAQAEHGQDSVEVGDLLTSIGVFLYMEARSSDDPAVGQASIKYLAMAIDAYKGAFGPVHPEVALAINSYADVLRQLAPGASIPPEVIPLLEEALRIRVVTLGPQHTESRSNMTRVANLKAENAGGDASTIAEAESLYRQALRGAPTDSEADRVTGAVSIRLKLARLLAENGRRDEAIQEVQLAIRVAADWEEEARCFKLYLDLIEMVELLEHKGDLEGSQRLGIMINQSGCFSHGDAPVEAVA